MPNIPPGSNVPTAPPGFPIEVLGEVTKHADELTLWSLRGYSRELVKIAEATLEPFLARKTLGVELSLVPTDIFHLLDVITADTDAARREELKEARQCLKDHLTAFPPSSTLLRNLTIEVKDDLPESTDLILKYREQLEVLRIRMVDRSGIPELEDTSIDPDELWAQMAVVEGRYRHVDFDLPILYTLEVYTTGRLLGHLACLVDGAPSLRHLIVGSNSVDEEDADWLGERIHDCESIERVTFHGLAGAMGEFSEALQCCPALRFLVISIMPNPIPEEADAQLAALHVVGHYPLLEGLCLYGSFVGLDADCVGTNPDCFPAVTPLVLERAQEEGPGKLAYPLLDPGGSQSPPAFPVLQQLVFIDRTGIEAVYDETVLKALFEEYTTLQLVEFIACKDYPCDPFADDSTSTPTERNVQSYVSRPEEEGPLVVVCTAAA